MINTGFKELDKLIIGLKNSELILIASRPAMGKTAFALNLALNAATKQNVSVGIFSLEMSKKQTMQRILAMLGKVVLSRLRKPFLLTGSDWSNIYHAIDSIAQCRLFIDDSHSLSVQELRKHVVQLKNERQLGLLIVDYLQLLQANEHYGSSEKELSDTLQFLKDLAVELDIPIVTTIQLSGRVQNGMDKRPGMEDLKKFEAIEQYADLIFFIYRDDVVKFKPSERPLRGLAEIILAKQQNESPLAAKLTFDTSLASFEDI